MLAEGVRHHQAGELDRAAALYDKILRKDPKNGDALHLLGVVANQKGDHARAATLIRRARQIMPQFAMAAHNLGWALHALGRRAEAEAEYRAAIDLDPRLAESHNNLGNLLRETGRRAEARAAYERAIAARPSYVEAHNNLGNLLLDLDRDDEAIEAFRRAIALAPSLAEAHNGLGTALNRRARFAEAAEAFRRAVAVEPGYATAWSNLATALAAEGHLEPALEAFDKATDLDPRFVEALANRGSILLRFGHWSEALATLRRAEALAPDSPVIQDRLLWALMALMKPDEALPYARKAYDRDPDDLGAAAALDLALQDVCDWSKPDLSPRVRAEAQAALARGGRPEVSPYHAVRTFAEPALNQGVAAAHAAEVWGTMETERGMLAAVAPRPPGERIRIGYVSFDFRDHAAAHLNAGIFALHDRARFEVFGYATSYSNDSAYRRRIETGCDVFVEAARFDHAALARRIKSDGIDIAVDLTGYTYGARPEVFACRPAPVQVNYQGYPGTLGAGYMDYAIVDAIAVPPAEDATWTEHLVRMPHCYLVSDHLQEIDAETPSRDSLALPRDGFVFASFNNYYKIEPVVFGIWMRLLDAVPGSVLWLASLSKDGQKNLRAAAATRGIDPARLVMAGRVPAKSGHLARLRQADLALDTLRFNGFGTTNDMLWAGVPVLTRRGTSLSSRVSASQLVALGVPELVVETDEDYEATALALARDPARLAALRARVVARRTTSPLFDTPRWVRHLESAYVTMVRRQRAGLAPAPIDIADAEAGNGPA